MSFIDEIKQSGIKQYWATEKVSLTDIAKLEQEFAITIPESYKTFLLQLGCGAFGYTEIFGLGCPNTGIPNIRFVVNAIQKCGQRFPEGVIPISEGNEGYFICIACKAFGVFEIGNIIACRASASVKEALDSTTLIASSFDKFCQIKLAAQTK